MNSPLQSFGPVFFPPYINGGMNKPCLAGTHFVWRGDHFSGKCKVLFLGGHPRSKRVKEAKCGSPLSLRVSRNVVSLSVSVALRVCLTFSSPSFPHAEAGCAEWKLIGAFELSPFWCSVIAIPNGSQKGNHSF